MMEGKINGRRGIGRKLLLRIIKEMRNTNGNTQNREESIIVADLNRNGN